MEASRGPLALAPDDRVVLIGGGQAAVQAALSLRDAGFTGSVAIIADEPGDPYQRPPLSKTYLQKPDGGALPLRTAAALAKKDVRLVYGRATSIDRDARTVTLESAGAIDYDHLVIATGARNRTIPLPGSDLDGVVGLRSLPDAASLRELLATPREIVVIGGGFIGSEFAASAVRTGHRVTLLEAADRLMARAISPELSAWIAALHRSQGTRVELGAAIEAIEGDGHVSAVRLTGGERIRADLVLLAVGVVPNAELAEQAGLPVSNGVVVDERLRTADERVSAIGDCVSFPCVHAGGPMRLESVQNATDQARHLAQVLVAGSSEPYVALPWFWTHQFDANVQMAGIGRPGDERVVQGDPDAGCFSVFRFDGGRLLCVESVNAPADHMAARRLLGSGRIVTYDDVVGAGAGVG